MASATGERPERESGLGATRRLLGRGSIYTLGTTLEAGSLLIAIPVVTRLLDPEEFGVVSIALVVAAVVGLVAPLGITTAITRFHFDGDRGPDETRALVIWAPLLAAGVAVILELTGAVWAPALAGLDYSGAIRLAVWSGPATAAMLGAQAALIAQDRPRQFITVSMISTAGAQLAAIGLVGFADAGATGYMAGFVGARTAGALVGMAFSGVNLEGARNMSLLRRGLMLGLPTVSHAVAMYLLNAGDRVIIGSIKGLAAAGRYQVAYVVGSLGIILLFSLTQAWGPLIYGAREDQRWQVLARTARTVYRLCALFSGALALVVPLGLLIAAPSSYELDSLIPVSAVVALSAVPVVTYLRNVIILFQVKRTRALLWAAPLATATNFALNLVLVPWLGLIGGGIATLGAFVLLGELLRVAARPFATVRWHAGEEARAWLIAGSLAAVSALAPGTGPWVALRLALAVPLAWLFFLEVRHQFRTGVELTDDQEPTTNSGERGLSSIART